MAGHECCVNGYVLEEARRNLVAKAPWSLAIARISGLCTAGRFMA
jgi:hypothetical protein